MLVVGRGKGEVGDGTEVGNVETAVVGGSVFAHKPRAVEAEHHRKGEDGTIVDDVVVSALGKGGVDVAEGDEPIFGHTGREGGGVAFGNAHIKGAFGHRFGQQVHGATGEHGRRDAHETMGFSSASSYPLPLVVWMWSKRGPVMSLRRRNDCTNSSTLWPS